jgi:hypothetical protein
MFANLFSTNWYIPNSDPWVMYVIGEITRWISDNWVTLLVISNILTGLQWLAFRTKNVYDDKVITLLKYFFSFKWLTDIKGQIGTKDNPITLKDKVE